MSALGVDVSKMSRMYFGTGRREKGHASRAND